MGDWRYTSHISDLSPRLSSVLSYMTKSLYPWENNPSYPQGETQNRYGRNGEKDFPSVGKKKADLQQYYAY